MKSATRITCGCDYPGVLQNAFTLHITPTKPTAPTTNLLLLPRRTGAGGARPVDWTILETPLSGRKAQISFSATTRPTKSRVCAVDSGKGGFSTWVKPSTSLQDMPHARSSNVIKALNLGILRKPGSLKSSWIPTRRSCSIQVKMENGLPNNSRGSLIVLEGLDRSGKTSQSNSLVSFLKAKGLSVEAWHFPDRSTTVGGMISSYLANKSQLDDRTIHLLFSANRWEKSSLMETKLKNGITLVVDRYSYSGVAFSAAKGLDIQWCKAPEEGLIAPDLVIYLDIPPEKAAERGGYGSERYEHLDFQRKVAYHYQNLHDNTWKVIDACFPVKDIENHMRDLALECISSCQNGRPLSKLWLSK